MEIFWGVLSASENKNQKKWVLIKQKDKFYKFTEK